MTSTIAALATIFAPPIWRGVVAGANGFWLGIATAPPLAVRQFAYLPRCGR